MFDQLGEAKIVRSCNLYWANSGASHGTNQGRRAGWSWSNEGFLLLRLFFFLFPHGCCPRGHTLTHAVKCFLIKFRSKLCVGMWVRERREEGERREREGERGRERERGRKREEGREREEKENLI